MSGLALMAPLALAALAPLAAIIVLLYLLKLRRHDVTVPSVFLWRQAIEDVQANAPFQRLRMSLLLLLQLIALVALVFGLAAPYVMARRLPGRTSVIVLDTSASMNATDVEGSRLEDALGRAREIAGAMTGRDEAALVVCGARTAVSVPMTGDRRRLQRGLDAVRPTDCATNLRDGLLLGASLASRREDAHLFLISDGAVDALPEPPSGVEVEFIRVGERSDNVAIVAFEAARPVGAEATQLFIRLHNYAKGAREVELAVYLDDAVLDARRISVPGGQDLVEAWEVAGAADGLLRAEIAVEDDLAADNVAFATAGAGGAGSVLVVGPGNLFLEQALLIQPELRVMRAESLAAAQAQEAYEQYDVVIFDRARVPVAPTSGAVLLIDAGGWTGLAARGESIDQPRIGSWEDDHPVLRHVNLAAVGIASAHPLTPGSGARVLAQADGAPLMVALERDDLRALALGWDLLDSDLPLRVGFPVLISNITRWLGEVRGAEDTRLLRPGATVRYAVAPEVERVSVELPGGETRRVAALDGEVTFADADRVGVYRLTAGDQQLRWAMDLRDAAESDLTPRAELTLGQRQVVASERELRTERHLWPWLAVLAIVALLAEWHFYHKRY